MSPLLGKRDDSQRESLSVGSRDLERAAQSEPGLDAEVARLEALSLLELAAEVMTKAVTGFCVAWCGTRARNARDLGGVVNGLHVIAVGV
jgi:hypothetical protein